MWSLKENVSLADAILFLARKMQKDGFGYGHLYKSNHLSDLKRMTKICYRKNYCLHTSMLVLKGSFLMEVLEHCQRET